MFELYANWGNQLCAMIIPRLTTASLISSRFMIQSYIIFSDDNPDSRLHMVNVNALISGRLSSRDQRPAGTDVNRTRSIKYATMQPPYRQRFLFSVTVSPSISERTPFITAEPRWESITYNWVSCGFVIYGVEKVIDNASVKMRRDGNKVSTVSGKQRA